MRRFAPWLLLTLLAGCSTTYPTAAGDLDTGSLPDHSILVSATVPEPTSAQKDQRVVITAHGYTATTYETHPVADYLRGQGMLVSEVLLGGHGTSIQDFEKSTWKTWQAPLIAEYNALVAKGFNNIEIMGTSTGGTLWLEALSRNVLNPAPQRIVLVDSLIEIHNKLAGYAGVLPWAGISYLDMKPTGNSVGHWYRFRPASTVVSLVDLTEIVKNRLKTGIQLPTDSKTLAIQATNDPTVEPASVDLITNGLRGGTVTPKKVNSNMHIPIWPDGVDNHVFTAEESALRTQLFQDIQQHLGS